MESEETQVVVFSSALHLVPVNGTSDDNQVGSRFAGVFAAPGLAGEPPAFVPQTVATLELFRFMSASGERLEAMRALRLPADFQLFASERKLEHLAASFQDFARFCSEQFTAFQKMRTAA